MRYFDFDALIHKAQILETFLMVAFVYILIFGVAYVYNRFMPK